MAQTPSRTPSLTSSSAPLRAPLRPPLSSAGSVRERIFFLQVQRVDVGAQRDAGARRPLGLVCFAAEVRRNARLPTRKAQPDVLQPELPKAALDQAARLELLPREFRMRVQMAAQRRQLFLLRRRFFPDFLNDAGIGHMSGLLMDSLSNMVRP